MQGGILRNGQYGWCGSKLEGISPVELVEFANLLKFASSEDGNADLAARFLIPISLLGLGLGVSLPILFKGTAAISDIFAHKKYKKGLQKKYLKPMKNPIVVDLNEPEEDKEEEDDEEEFDLFKNKKNRKQSNFLGEVPIAYLKKASTSLNEFIQQIPWWATLIPPALAIPFTIGWISSNRNSVIKDEIEERLRKEKELYIKDLIKTVFEEKTPSSSEKDKKKKKDKQVSSESIEDLLLKSKKDFNKFFKKSDSERFLEVLENWQYNFHRKVANDMEKQLEQEIQRLIKNSEWFYQKVTEETFQKSSSVPGGETAAKVLLYILFPGLAISHMVDSPWPAIANLALIGGIGAYQFNKAFSKHLNKSKQEEELRRKSLEVVESANLSPLGRQRIVIKLKKKKNEDNEEGDEEPIKRDWSFANKEKKDNFI